MKRFYILIIILFLNAGILVFSLYAQQENNQSQWPEFAKWYKWKIQSQLTEKQREVVKYLDKAVAIYNKASLTETVQAGSQYGHPSPKEAINIVKESIKELMALPYPKACKRYRAISLGLMRYIIDYHELRLKYKEGSKEFDKKQAKLFIEQTKENLNSDQFNEYFKSMRDVGLFDNIEKEMADLGLIDKEELEAFYGYFQEIDIGTIPKCPKCSEKMRRVPIIYGNVKEDEIYKEGKLIALPGGDMQNYPDRPKFAYICDKDYTWYEEYPSPNKGKFIIRKWGWGLYNWRYKNRN